MLLMCKIFELISLGYLKTEILLDSVIEATKYSFMKNTKGFFVKERKQDPQRDILEGIIMIIRHIHDIDEHTLCDYLWFGIEIEIVH